jgi:hypothetical protein
MSDSKRAVNDWVKGHGKAGTNGKDESNDSTATEAFVDVSDIDHEFWTARESLQTIYTASLARMAPPWAVLGVCAAKILAIVPPHVVLPPLIGSKGSLNLFVALAAESGGGKSISLGVADDVIKEFVRYCNIGSGEGMVDAYRCKPNDEAIDGVYESMMFIADEIDTLTAMRSSKQSTTMTMLRTAFSGGTLGASTKASNGFHLKAHSYRLTLVVGAQPGRAGVLLDDVAGGTPQRFIWFPATDNRISANRPGFPVPLTLPQYRTWLYPRELRIPGEASESIINTREKVARGEGNPIDSHRLYVREKLAYALTSLDGRDEMTSDDWELSGIAMAVSDRTREWITRRIEAERDKTAERDGRIWGVRQDAADETRAIRSGQRRAKAEGQIKRRVQTAGADGIARNDVLQAFPGRDRGVAQTVFEQLVADGVLVEKEMESKRYHRWILADDDEF